VDIASISVVPRTTGGQVLMNVWFLVRCRLLMLFRGCIFFFFFEKVL
jgi:hypothetical protein